MSIVNSAATVKSKVDAPELVARRRTQFIDAAIKLFGQHGYHVTTIKQIADAAGVSIGLIYQYVQDKEDILFLALLRVLESYKERIPLAMEQHKAPLDRFRAAIQAYCHVNDENSNATILAYRETKSLGKQRRLLIQQKETETNDLLARCIQECIDEKLIEPVDLEMLTYQIVMFCHTWALKAWHFRRRMTVDEYVDRGIGLMIQPILTAKGRRAFRH